jgi:hypothetical protein
MQLDSMGMPQLMSAKAPGQAKEEQYAGATSARRNADSYLVTRLEQWGVQARVSATGWRVAGVRVR